LDRRWLLAIGLSSAAFVTPFDARAQVHWDAGAQAGATDRIATGAVPSRSPGPSGEIHAHVAVYPMLRVGPYAAFDLSPVSGLPDRRVYSAGARAKVTPPWLAAPWRVWGFLGFGIAYAYAPSTPSLRSSSTTMPEVPVGVGMGYRLHGPWELCAELGARWNLAGIGGQRSAPAAGASMVEPFLGNDLLAVSLGVGVSLAL